jgi:hypothetical protein
LLLRFQSDDCGSVSISYSQSGKCGRAGVHFSQGDFRNMER